MNRGKKSISLDLRKREGQEVFRNLIEKSDIVIENFVKGTMERWEIGYNDLKKINSGLIYLKISGFGNEGLEKYTKKTAFDLIIQAEAGILDALDIEEGPPKLPIADYTAGHVGAIAISQALYYREKTGNGQFIDISMHDLMYAINMRAQAKEFIPMAQNLDLGSKFLPIYNQYPTKDGLIVFTTLTEKQWKNLAKNILKKPELITDSRFNNPIKRFNYVDLLDEIIKDWTKSVNTDEAISVLELERIPCGKSISMFEAVNHPNLNARGVLNQEFDFSKYNVQKASIPGPLIKFSETKGEVESAGPEFANNNQEIFEGLLGYSPEKIEKLKKKKVI